MQVPIKIANVEIKPGQRKMINLPIPHLYTHTELNMPVHVIHGKKEGPRLFVSAAIHGDEINGIEIIRRLLGMNILKNLRGTLITIPVVNVYGFLNSSRYPPDRRDLNRCFPGIKGGSLTSSLAKLFMEQIVEKCTHGIDLHTGSNDRTNLPQIRAFLDDPETERLALAFGTPVIINSKIRDGSLREAVREKGIPVLLYEAGEALRFDELSIKTGVKGIISVMREIGLLKKRIPKKGKMKPLLAHSTTWVRAPSSGILSARRAVLGASVSKDEVLGVIADPFGENEEPISAPISGIIIGRLNCPLVHQGDALFHIAPFEKLVLVDNTVEAWREGISSAGELREDWPTVEEEAPPAGMD